MDKNNIEMNKIAKAIEYIDNEAIKLRDQTKAVKNEPKSFEFINSKKKELYSIKDKVLTHLYKQNLLITKGYIKQEVDNHKNKIYELRIIGDETNTSIQSIFPYTSNLQDKNKEIGNIGLIPYRNLDGDLTLDEALTIAEEYLKSNSKPKKKEFFTNNYTIKETKLVELSKIKIVKDIHNQNNINKEKYKLKKDDLEELISNHKGVYPKARAILVLKRKDPEDKRRVIYHLEDGLIRYLISKEIGLEKIYVNVIDESKMEYQSKE
ncbi:hypothetical protein [Anaerophilus nitritogenes]|uniref:hypothetical protein n=1 Tax=Anaerophilus nitritogenes TaxID=2498136 RepID=UPI00101C6895|nr:hypothetical protein [Anaerophilus nitritogenes]